MRPIDADALREHIRLHCGICGEAVECIAEAPTIDAVPVVHGRWVNVRTENDIRFNSDGEEQNNYYQNATCSACRVDGFPEWKFCPSCGAKMDKEEPT